MGAWADDGMSPAAKAELAKLQGTWFIVSTERDGKLEPQPNEPGEIVIQDNKILLGERDVQLRITLLHLDSMPKLIDITQIETKQRLEGVYELSDGEWRICLNTHVDGAANRPAEMKTIGQPTYALVVLRREKP
jgi:uncharacterized protein (TIGR03067 family)